MISGQISRTYYQQEQTPLPKTEEKHTGYHFLYITFLRHDTAFAIEAITDESCY